MGSRESSKRDGLEPLRGIRILDLTRYAPGPFCTLVCSALGAEVIKVEERAGGDPLRRLDPAAFARLNAGKKSVALDLKAREARGIVGRLASTADVLVEGFRPGVTSRLGLDYESLKAVNATLVYVSITGYGQSGPYRGRAGHDVNYMALAGALGNASDPLPLQVADFAAGGLFAATALLAALLQRKETGAGGYLDLAMHHGLLSLMMLASGEAADRLSGRFPNYAIYTTRDGGRIAVGALEPKFWERFCAVLERPDLVGRIADPEARADVEKVIGEKDLGYWEPRFTSSDSCVEIVLPPDLARTHPQALHRGAASDGFSLPFAAGSRDLGPAPDLSEHCEEVLGALGLSPEELDGLRGKGVC